MSTAELNHTLAALAAKHQLIQASGDERQVRAVTVNMMSVVVKELRWLWPTYLPLGKVGLLDGDPCLGKSLATLDLAARVSTGQCMPDGSRGDLHGPAGVVLLSAEDDAADTIKPRLLAAGADCSRIELMTGVREATTDDAGETHYSIRPPTLEDIEQIRESIDKVQARFVVIDPLMAFLTGDAHRDQDARQGLAPLKTLAEETGAAILVVRHLNKSGGSNAMYRGTGSIGIIGACRAGMIAARDPDDETGRRRILARTKSNLGPDEQASIAYQVVAPDGAPRIEWLGASKHTAASLLSVPADQEERTRLADAAEWLKDALKDGQELAKNIYKKAKADGISDRTLERAKSVLRVESSRGLAGWLWELPKDEGRQQSPLGDLEKNTTKPPENIIYIEDRQDRQAKELGDVGDLGGVAPGRAKSTAIFAPEPPPLTPEELEAEAKYMAEERLAIQAESGDCGVPQ